MKRLLIFWGLLAAPLLVGAATVQVSTRQFNGSPNRLTLVFTPQSGPVVVGTNTVHSGPVKVLPNPTNGIAQANLVTGLYRLTFEGLSGYSEGFVPDTNGVVSWESCITTAPTPVNLSQYYTRNQVDALVAAGGGSGGTNVVTSFGLLSTNVLWVSAFSGNDATAEKNNPGKPWMTVWSAMTSAVSGDTIRMTRGQYIETNSIGGNGVNLYLEPDAVLGSNYKIAGVDGPVLEAGEGVEFSVYGIGSILARSNAVKAAESGRINFDGATIDPPPVYMTNIFGRWVTQ